MQKKWKISHERFQALSPSTPPPPQWRCVALGVRHWGEVESMDSLLYLSLQRAFELDSKVCKFTSYQCSTRQQNRKILSSYMYLLQWCDLQNIPAEFNYSICLNWIQGKFISQFVKRNTWRKTGKVKLATDPGIQTVKENRYRMLPWIVSIQILLHGMRGNRTIYSFQSTYEEGYSLNQPNEHNSKVGSKRYIPRTTNKMA